MLKKNRKGFSLTELLITLAIVGLFSPLVFVIFVSGIEDYNTTSKYMIQQYSVMEVTRLIRQDIEEAKEVKLSISDYSTKVVDEIEFIFDTSSSKPKRKWKFEEYIDSATGEASYGLCLSINGATYERLVDKLDLGCSFKVDTIDEMDDAVKPTKVILTIKPESLNKNKYRGRNVKENIITEFSVRYKEIS